MELIIDPCDLSSGNWTELNSVSTVEGGSILGTSYTKVANTTTTVGYVYQDITTSFTNLSLTGSVVLKRGSSTNNSTRFIIQNTTTTENIMSIEVDFDNYPSDLSTPSTGIILEHEWYDSETIRVYFKCADLDALTDNVQIRCYASEEPISGEYNYFSQVQLIDNSSIMSFPFVDGVSPAKFYSEQRENGDPVFPESNQFYFDMIIEPKAEYDDSNLSFPAYWMFWATGNLDYLSFSYDSEHRFCVYWTQGGVETKLSSQVFDDGSTETNLNQRIRIIGSIDLTTTNVNSSRLIVIPLESGELFEQNTWSVTPEIKSILLENIDIGHTHYEEGQPYANMEYLRIYDGLLTDTITSLEDVDALFPKEKLLFLGMGEIGNFDGNDFNNCDSEESNTFGLGKEISVSTSKPITNGSDLFIPSESASLTVVDLKTDSFSSKSTRIIHK